MLQGPRAQRGEQPAADAGLVPIGAHAHQLQAQRRLHAAELAGEHTREDEAGEAAGVVGGELRVQRRLAQCGAQAALDVVAPRVPFGHGVDRHHRRQVGGSQRAQGDLGVGDALRHGGLQVQASA
jgi:hypothetical protein